MRAIALGLLLAAGPVSAQPVTPSTSCAVTIARAPEDVREVVEAWVRSEAVCNTTLEVRIVPTDGGFYLLAQDPEGGTRERIVPDAQSAGVLVASWIADDSMPQPAPPPAVEPAPAVAQPPAPLVQPSTQESFTPPGLARSATVAHQPASRTKWLTLGALAPLTSTSGVGLRSEWDMKTSGRLSFGVAGSVGSGRINLVGNIAQGELQTGDAKLVLYAARTWQLGRWQLRPALGLGAVYTDGLVTLRDTWGNVESHVVDGVTSTVEASVTISRDIGRNWALYTGPVATLLSQEFAIQMETSSSPGSVIRKDLDLALVAGVRHRL